MVYRAIGLMSAASLDGLDIAYAEFQETSGKWNFEIKAATRYPYTKPLIERLKNASTSKAFDYQVLHSDYGHLIGELVNRFIEENNLHHQVQLVVSHGHPCFHEPEHKMTAQLGHGAAIAAVTGINTVSDLRAIDMARAGLGTPIVPIGEKLLFTDYPAFLHLGEVASISNSNQDQYVSLDICPASQVFRMLAADANRSMDETSGKISSGRVDEKLLSLLNDLEYYHLPYPKSLSKDFGTDVLYTLIKNKKIGFEDSWRTYIEHVALQIKNALQYAPVTIKGSRMLTTGTSAHNGFLIERINSFLKESDIELSVPDKNIVDFKEALIMALIGILRWREENNTIASVTGATADSIGGAVWIGQEA